MSSKSDLVYVITGSTRGIGFGLARELLQKGQKVFICGRSRNLVEAALGKLGDGNRVGGTPCDISCFEDVQRLWDAAVAKFGRVDVFINSAAAAPHATLATIGTDQLSSCVDTNVKNALYCCKVAIAGMGKQFPSGGRIYLMEGLGSDGRLFDPETAIYGATKFAGTYIANSIEAELKAGRSTIRIGRINPGMVTTDLLLATVPSDDPVKAEHTRKIINILGDKETTVTPWLAERLLRGDLTIRWLSSVGIMGRFIRSIFLSRDLFASEGNEQAASGSATDRAP